MTSGLKTNDYLYVYSIVVLQERCSEVIIFYMPILTTNFILLYFPFFKTLKYSPSSSTDSNYFFLLKTIKQFQWMNNLKSTGTRFPSCFTSAKQSWKYPFRSVMYTRHSYNETFSTGHSVYNAYVIFVRRTINDQ